MNAGVPGIVKKITEADPNTFVVYFRRSCPYSIRAIRLLESGHFPTRAYDVEQIPGGKDAVIATLRRFSGATGFRPDHTTVPMIFRNGRFIGGCSDLEYLLNQLKM